MLKKIFDTISEQELLVLKLEQPELYQLIKELSEIKNKAEECIEKIKNFENTYEINFKKNDKFVLAYKDQMEKNLNSYFVGLGDSFGRATEIINNRIILPIEDKLENSVIIKRKKCEQCGELVNGLYSINRKEICNNCI